MREHLKQGNIAFLMDGCYVYDSRNAVELMSRGTRWNPVEIKFTRTEEDKMQNEKADIRKGTRDQIVSMMNSINKDLVFMSELEEDFPSGKLPTLDMKNLDRR